MTKVSCTATRKTIKLRALNLILGTASVPAAQDHLRLFANLQSNPSFQPAGGSGSATTVDTIYENELTSHFAIGQAIRDCAIFRH